MDFNSEEDAKAAKEAMEDGEIDGNKVTLDWAKPKGEGGFGGRGGGRGGFGGRGGGRGGRGGFGGRGRGGFGGKERGRPPHCVPVAHTCTSQPAGPGSCVTQSPSPHSSLWGGSTGSSAASLSGTCLAFLQGEAASEEAEEEEEETTSHKERRPSLNSFFYPCRSSSI